MSDRWRMRPYGLRPRMSVSSLERGRRRTPEWFAERMAQVPFCHAEEPNMQLLPVDLQRTHYVRVRCNGVWLPKGRRALYPAYRVTFLIAQHMQQMLPKRGDAE